MRIALLAVSLLALAGCVQPAPNQTAVNAPLDGKRFTQPTGGSAYSESDPYYYYQTSSPANRGGAPPKIK